MVRRVDEGIYWPNPREQDHHMLCSLMGWILARKPIAESLRVEVLVNLALLNYGRQTIYVDPGLGKMLINAELPRDLSAHDLRWPWPSFRMMLPKGLITGTNNLGQKVSLSYVDSFLCDDEEESGKHLGASEQVNRVHLDELQDAQVWAENTKDEPPSDFDSIYDLRRLLHPEPMVYLSALSDYQEEGHLYDGFTSGIPWRDKQLREMIQSNAQMSNSPVMVPGVLEQARTVLFNLLIFLGEEPRIVPHQWIRKPRMEGKHQKSGLAPARYASQMRKDLWEEPPRHEVMDPTGVYLPKHWVKSHYRRQHYGKGLCESKLIRIGWYTTTGRKYEEALAEKHA